MKKCGVRSAKWKKQKKRPLPLRPQITLREEETAGRGIEKKWQKETEMVTALENAEEAETAESNSERQTAP
jgi:hypothetical protein